jgi:hypothetical protein
VFRAIRRPHEAADAAAAGEESIDEMPADEAGAAGEEDGLHGSRSHQNRF